MKKYFNLYRIFWSQHLQEYLLYKPAMTLFSFMAHGSWVFFTFVFLSVVSSPLEESIRNQLLLFLGYFHIVKALFWIHSSVGSGFLAGSAFREGKIDFFIIRPFNTQWAVSSVKPNFFAFTDLLIGIGTFVYFAGQLGLSSPEFFATATVAAIISAVLLYGIWFSYLAIFVPTGEASAIHGLVSTFWVYGQFPGGVFQTLLTKLITHVIFPVVLITTVPMEILQGNLPLYWLIIMAFAAALALLISRKLFDRMLRFYTSAN